MLNQPFFRVCSLSLLCLIGGGVQAQNDPPDVAATAVASEPATPVETEPNPAPPKVGEAIQQFLGEAIIHVLANPDRVDTFRVAFMADANSPLNLKVAEFPVLEQGPELEPGLLKAFQSLVFSDKSYIWEADKRCMFFPELGLRFVKGEQVVEVLVSFYCDLLLFVHEGEQKMEDCDPISQALGQFRDALFPLTDQ
ncbi:MAG: hypothetical protein DRR16_12925 [Candidatus Parabeggiatoa sp. nov. 3]|nr:MAG: hypothetical protein DRR00_18445 [Gammaproteobacteria bacterium]RKZ64697.1 MAG: hypothetical protein DRQ99_14995 [Gammaproteobacteria bacterium]RKZ85088.1 MAG: hypothetical protein DRR16_12925 [Gammaproteobacteria bacterium]